MLHLLIPKYFIYLFFSLIFITTYIHNVEAKNINSIKIESNTQCYDDDIRELHKLSKHSNPTAMMLYLYNMLLSDVENMNRDFLNKIYHKIFEHELLLAFFKDRDTSAEGNIGLLDYMPLLHAQDSPVSMQYLRLINNCSSNKDIAKIEINLNFHKPRVIIVTLKREKEFWKIYDTETQDNNESLRKTLKALM